MLIMFYVMSNDFTENMNSIACFYPLSQGMYNLAPYDRKCFISPRRFNVGFRKNISEFSLHPAASSVIKQHFHKVWTRFLYCKYFFAIIVSRPRYAIFAPCLYRALYAVGFCTVGFCILLSLEIKTVLRIIDKPSGVCWILYTGTDALS